MNLVHKSKIFIIAVSILSLIFTACTGINPQEDFIDLKERFYWAPCDEKSTVRDAENMHFHKFSTEGIANIKKTVGKNQDYIWLMATFTVPRRLQHQPLGLLITYLHFADKVWINGNYVGGYGSFPPNAKSALWASHFYSIPEALIKRSERNTIYIKVYCQGAAGISDNIFIGNQSAIKHVNDFYTFRQSIIYVFSEGGMFFTAILFILIFVGRKQEREYLTFALLCIASMIFITPFFAPQFPLYNSENFKYTFFIKNTLCTGLYLMAFFLTKLIIDFVKKEESRAFRILRYTFLLVCIIPTLFAPSYSILMKICPITLVISIIQVAMSFVYIFHQGLRDEEKSNFRIIGICFLPMIISILTDFIIRGGLQKVDVPYITLFGWLLTISIFIVFLSIRYNNAIMQNEYLNVQLKREVLKQTRELSKKNSSLTEQITRNESDLEMASLVQKKFFPYPPKTLRGWDIAVSYSPLDKVSGDMYDFYTEHDNLEGFSLFDVSGHGIAASLVTMLAKNIIFQSFIRNFKKHETVSRTLYEINDEIIEAKGGIENYLTGLMFRFGLFNENDECLVEMANAGHPNPILYSAKSNICDEIESGDSEEHHGAIGLDFITVSFPQINFTMAEDDILFFYTDGLSEGRNSQNEMFGKERIKRIIKENYAKDAQSIMEEIVDNFNTFTAGVKRDDDITMVVMKRENSANFIEELDEV